MQMLYACPNVRTTTHGGEAQPAADEGVPRARASSRARSGSSACSTSSRRSSTSTRSSCGGATTPSTTRSDERPFSGKNLLECYRRAEPHWERRHEVRARSTDTVKRGVGMASQIWYGGGGPPSYAWVRVGSDGRATVVTAMQDVGTGTKTAMAQIAAEELGLPLEHVTVSRGDSARGPYATISAGSSTIPSMGPAVRAAAADAKRQILELAAQRGDAETPLEEVVGLLENGQILGTGARGPNPTGMQVLTFGVQVAEVAVDVETGEVTVDRIAAIHDVGRVINPLGASSQIEGGIIQGIGHTLSEERLHDPRTGAILTTSFDAYRLPTIADVPEIVSELVDVPDAQLTNLGSKGLGEPPIVPVAAAIANAIRDATGADVRSLPITREEMLRALREARTGSRRAGGVELRRPSSLDELEPASNSLFLAGGTEVVPLLRDGLLAADELVDVRGVVPRGIDGRAIGAGTTLAELEASTTVPDALREACRLAASPQLRNVGTLAGNLLQSTRCWYWRLKWPCRLHGGDTCLARDGRAPRARDLRQRLLRLGAPVRRRRGAARARRDAPHRPARAAARRALPAADRGRPAHDDARAGRADPRARRAAAATGRST